jgi:acyl-homoserine lactone synthase
MMHVASAENRDAYARDLALMHAHRRRVFVEALKWPLRCEGELEIDEYDSADAIYLLHLSERGELLASVRLLRTDAPHMMGALFAHLCETPAPTGPRVWEVSRFCPAPELDAAGRRASVGVMTAGVLEAGLLFGIEAATFVAGGALRPLALAAGWHVTPLGPTQRYQNDRITACVASIDVEGLQRVRARYGLKAPLLRYVPARRAA